MASINSVTLMGNLGSDPELATTKTGKSWCKFRIATHYSQRAENGERQEFTTWHNVKAYGKTAEVCQTYLKKGRMAVVEGRIQNSSYKKEDGTDGFWSEIVARDVKFIGGGRSALADLNFESPSANEIPF